MEVGGWEVEGEGGGRLGRWEWEVTGPYRQAHPRSKPKTTPTVPNRTVTPMNIGDYIGATIGPFPTKH